MDYRRLNAKTAGDAYPLPRIQESLDALVGDQFIKDCPLWALVQQYSCLFLKDGVLHRKNIDQQHGVFEQLVLPSTLWPDVVAALHDKWVIRAINEPWSC